MPIKVTKLDKRTFFNNLKDYVGDNLTIKLMHAQHQIAALTVTKNGARFTVKVNYVGNSLKRRKTNWSSETETVNAISWNSLSYSEEQIFDFRTIEVVETVPEPEVKPTMADKPVVIKTVPHSDTRLIHLRYVIKGHPFWYQGQLYQRTNIDSHNALRLIDGCLCCLAFDLKVLATTIEVSVTGDVP